LLTQAYGTKVAQLNYFIKPFISLFHSKRPDSNQNLSSAIDTTSHIRPTLPSHRTPPTPKRHQASNTLNLTHYPTQKNTTPHHPNKCHPHTTPPCQHQSNDFQTPPSPRHIPIKSITSPELEKSSEPLTLKNGSITVKTQRLSFSAQVSAKLGIQFQRN